MKHPLVLAITGASGVVYALRLLEVLLRSGCEVHLTVSPSGRKVLELELGIAIDLERFDARGLAPEALAGTAEAANDMQRLVARIVAGLGAVVRRLPLPAGSAGARPVAGTLCYHHCSDFGAPIASGSFLTSGMVVCPCSGNTLSAIAQGASANLVQRAADIHLKERRKLIVVPRETPVSSIQLGNMQRVAEAGAVVLPAMPGWYHGVQTMGDLVDFVVARILDQLGIEHALVRRWGGSADRRSPGIEETSGLSGSSI